MVDPYANHILRPTIFKIMLTAYISLFTIAGWIGIIVTPEVPLTTIILYFIFTFLWIVFSGFASSLLLHYSKHSRITRATSFVIVSFIVICSGTMVYAFLK